MSLRALHLLPFIGIATMASAQDKYGGEFRFMHMSGLTYTIEFQIYSDPNSQSGPPWIVVNCGDGGTDTVSASSTVIIESNACEAQVQMRTFTTQHTYPGPGSYSLTVQTSDRVPNITNIPGSVNVPLCVPAQLVISSSGAADSSPVFMSAPYSSYFNGTVFTHDPQAYDADGDSLAFDLVVPRGQNCDPIPDYSFPDEVQPGASTLTIDPHTGVIQWNDPPMTGYFVIAIRCTEWRNGTMLGQVVRDMTLCLFSLTGITEHTTPPLLSVVPSVSSGEVEVTTTHGLGMVELMDMQGRSLRRVALSSDRTILDTRSLAAGSYLLLLINNQAVTATARFIVPRR